MSLIETRIQNIRANSNLDKNELRPSRYGGLDLFMMQTDAAGGIVTEELAQKAASSIGSLLQTPVIDYDAGVTIGNARTLTIPDDENVSRMINVTFATYAWGFTMVPVLFNNNEISMQKDFETKFLKYLYKFADSLDTVAIGSLTTAKTQVFKDLLNYSQVGNVIKCPWVDRENLVGDLNPMLAANDHYGNIHVVGNAGIESTIRKLAQKDIYNSENKTLEYSDKTFHFSTRLANAADEFANGFAVAENCLGILSRFEREALAGTSMADGTEWGISSLPMLNLPVSTYFYESKGDFSTIAGAASADMDRVRKEHFGFSVDLAFITSYNSDPTTIANPVMKFAINRQV